MAKKPRRATKPIGRKLPGFNSDRRGVDALATWARLFIFVISASLAALFAWLQIKDVPVVDAIRKVSPELLTKAALVIYFLGWVGGTNFDTTFQQRAYMVDPKRGRITAQAVILVVLFFCAALALLWARSSERLFGSLLGMFTVANILGWRHIVQRVRPIISASRSKFVDSGDLFGLEQLNVVATYMTGQWQIRRFITMLVLVALTCLVTMFDDARYFLGSAVNSFVPDISTDIAVTLLPGFCLLVFVLVAEGWIWLKRVEAWLACRVIADLEERYELKVRAG